MSKKYTYEVTVTWLGIYLCHRNPGKDVESERGENISVTFGYSFCYFQNYVVC